MPATFRRVLPFLAAVALATGCVTKPPVARPSVPAGATPKLAAEATTLTGKVKLLSDAGGNIISDNGGGIISDNGGGIISNNSGAIIANNGSGLTAKVKQRLLATKGPREFALADAKITVLDAAGKPALGTDGTPLAAMTDAQGNYKLAGVLPARNLVLRIRLWNGGELSAMLPRATGKTASQAIDTASSLAATYVLSNYVRGDQPTFDKLPGAEAVKLQAGLTSAQALIEQAPDYKPETLVALTDTLRSKAPAVDGTLKEIQALLLGQARLGEGLQATSVAIYGPRAIALDQQNNLYVAEFGFGRIRQVSPDGKLSTFADVVRGKVKRNFPALQDAVRAPDGTFYICGNFTAGTYVYKISPSGEVSTAAGTGKSDAGAVDVPATSTSLSANRMAIGPDGTLYIGEAHTLNGDLSTARLLSLGSDGILRNIAMPPITRGMQIYGVAAGADGALYVLVGIKGDGSSAVLRRGADGTVKTLASGFTIPEIEDGYLALAPDGTVYVSEPHPARVTAIAPDGTRRVVAGEGAAGAADLAKPRNLLVAPDGTLLVADVGLNLIRALGPDGSWKVRAGTTRTDGGGDLRALAIDGPYGVAFDAQNHLVVAETGSNRIDRFDGAGFTTIAGSVAGLGGDGGPATSALLAAPKALAEHDGTLWVIDAANSRLRKVRPDGVIETAAGDDGALTLKPGERVPASNFRVRAIGLAIGPDGRPYWSSGSGQILRLAADGFVELVAGVGHSSDTIVVLGPDVLPVGAEGPAKRAPLSFPGGLAFDSQGDLYVADTASLLVSRIHDPGGVEPTISTYAGTPFSAFLTGLATGDTASGKTAHEVAFFGPSGLAFDAQDNLYVAELGRVALPLYLTLPGDQLDLLFSALPPSYSRVRKIARDGAVTNVAGPDSKYFPDPTSEDGLVMSIGVAIAPDGRLAIADPGANLIRVLPAGTF
ncbi:MAG: repeat containing protein [Cyanobacteria bacterium RYN_339]|nr:repeat containing protein [Cyanobacteria bacterium RYN_339]